MGTRESRFLTRLRKELPEWVRQGWIASDNREHILNHVATQDAGGIRYMPLAFSILGAVLLGTGVITFFAAHWDEISKLIKLVLLFGVMWTAYGFSAYFLDKGGRPQFGNAILLLGIILFGANIMLIAQIYHIDAHFPNGVLLWSLGALLAAYLLHSQPAMVAAILLGLLWTFLESRDFRGDTHWLFLFLWVFFISPIYKNRWAISSHLALIGFLIWSAMAFPSIHVTGLGIAALSELDLLQLYFLTYLAIYLFAATMVAKGDASVLFHGGRIYSALAGMTCLWILAFPDVQDSGHTQPTATSLLHFALVPEAILTLAGALGVLLLAVWHWNQTERNEKAPGIRWGYMLGALIVAIQVTNLFIHYRYPEFVAVLFNVLYFSSNLWIIYAAFHHGDRFMVNFGFVFFAVGLVARYFDTFWTLLNRSYFFMIGGLLLIVGGFILEKQRRKLNERMPPHPMSSGGS